MKKKVCEPVNWTTIKGHSGRACESHRAGNQTIWFYTEALLLTDGDLTVFSVRGEIVAPMSENYCRFKALEESLRFSKRYLLLLLWNVIQAGLKQD